MKPADAKAPKFDAAWWKQNKAKDADPKGLFQGALGDYQKVKAAFVKDPGDPLDLTRKLDVVIKVAKAIKADPKLGALQKDTKDALASYEKIAAATQNAIATASKNPDLQGDLADLIKRQSKALESFCQGNHTEENYEFLVLMSKKVQNGKVYDRYVKLNSAKQINISGGTLNAMDKVAADGDSAKWDSAPWKDATTEIFEVVKRDTMPKYRTALRKQLFGAIKLP